MVQDLSSGDKVVAGRPAGASRRRVAQQLAWRGAAYAPRCCTVIIIIIASAGLQMLSDRNNSNNNIIINNKRIIITIIKSIKLQ